MPKLITTEQFIEKAMLIHNNFYMYNLTCYINNSTKIVVTCPIHGNFHQTPGNHLMGHGCPNCRNEKLGKLKRSNIQEFIQKSIELHGNKNDYSKANYTNNRTKVCVTCLTYNHGDYWITPNNHLKGKGCPKCKSDKLSLDRRITIEQFIEKARVIHGNKYNYSKSIPTNYHLKVIIICSKHGEFKQTIGSHLSGSGCPVCKKSKGELTIIAILEKYNIDFIDEYRIPEIANELYYDFYLPEYRLLIEFHGIQHYQYSPHFHRKGEDDFLKQKERDDFIRSNARQFKYRFLEFNYKQLEELSKDQFEQLVLNKI